MDALEKFQRLLRELFQFDCQDLDFGIYRILNYKRKQVEEFITARLPQIVDEAFAAYAAVDKAAAEQELARLRQEIEETGKKLGQTPFDAKGQLILAFHETPLGKQYLEAQERARSVQVAEELKTRVYNDLYTFFSRYYEDGDFISKRRYGRNETYAIPYNGEEVVLHWANRDQYYVKTGEQFKTYRFTAGDYAVAFELRSADTEQNNNKGSKRYFVLADVEQVDNLLHVFFEYRPLTDLEQETYGKTEQQRPQDKLNEAAAQAVLEQVKDPTLKARLASAPPTQPPPQGGRSRSAAPLPSREGLGEGASLLLKHLTRFTRRNTSDFFVHKDLRGFLRRELDFFIKHECLLLDELLTSPASNLSYVHLTRGRVVRDIGEKLIDFLAQVEDFQRRLFEKKKFVVRTEYCLTVDRLPEDLWDEALDNTAQIAEWRELFALDDLMKNDGLLNNGLDKDFLRRHPSLVVDTRHFSEDFKWRLLASFDDLDDALDGVLIKSENFQALNLLLEKYRERVKCIYIDPPYNTGNDEFLYRDNYQHSCWLAMMTHRLQLAKELLGEDGLFFTSIDYVEVSRLRLLCDDIFGTDNFLADIAWEKRYTRSNNAKLFYSLKDTLLAYRSGAKVSLLREPRTEKSDANYSNPDNDPRGDWIGSSYVNPATKEERPNLVYSIRNPFTGQDIVHPTHAWKYEPEMHQQHVKDNRLYWGKDGSYKYPRLKSFLSEAGGGLVPVDVWHYKDSGTTDEGGNELKALFGSAVFDNPKPTRLIRRMLELTKNFGSDEVALDFFAGSGTTAHAVINLNREDDSKRKYILVEMGDYFDTVLLPRIKKVVFCEKWKDGKPNGGAGVSHFVKYHTLEQYEDTLNNLELPREQDGQLAMEMFGDEYLLRYMLEFETQGSPCLLNLDRFKDPFAYRLKVQEGDAIVERRVDVVETFNYLLGIQVKKVRTFMPAGCGRYVGVLGEKDGKRVVVVWRALNGLEEDKDALMADKAFIEQTVLPALLGEGVKPDRLLVNGACYVEGVEAIEAEFKRLMFAGVQ